jgi:hypothetical protein
VTDTLTENPPVNPADAQEASALFAQITAPSAPTIQAPEDDVVHLPGGLVRDGRTYTQIKVRELTGADEEEIAKALPHGPVRLASVMLNRGIAEIGGEPATRSSIDALLLGDRDAALLGIRRVTFGADIEVPNVRCRCEEVFDVTLTVQDIRYKRLERPEDATFEVPLRKGGHAVVRLATGEDQQAAFERVDLTASERNTILLSRCVQTLVDRHGGTHEVRRQIDMVRDRLGIADRARILREMTDRQPGPLLDEVMVTHETCGNEISVGLGMMDLFQGL